MKTTKRVLSVILALAMVFCLTACGSKEDPADSGEFTYGKGIDENGYWEGIKALDLVKLPSTDNLMITPAEINEQVDLFKASFPDKIEIKEGVTKTGDEINIDFVGYIDGEAFENGSSQGQGYDLTLGEGMMIPGFEDSIIGHSVGESFQATATFPENYGVDALNGKEAVFDVTINYIIGYQDPEVNDDFVVRNLSSEYGWLTRDDMMNGIKANLALEALYADSTISETPQSMIDYQTEALVDYYKQYAAVYNLDFDAFLSTYVGVADEAALREQSADYCKEQASYYLFIQALAEKFGIVVNEDDIKAYYDKYYGEEASLSYQDFTGEFGMPYLKNIVLPTVIQQHMLEIMK